MAHSARTEQPPVNTVSQGAAGFKFALLDPANDVWFFTCPETPTDGTSGDGAGWAGPGSLCISLASGAPKLYINGGAGTKASPAWKIVTSA